MGVIGKLFKNGRSQAVRIPAEFRFEGTEVEFRPGPNPGEVILSSKVEAAGTLDAFFKSRTKIPDWELEGFLEHREQGQHERDDPLA
ncbi:AbrB/MazE/SpoVT family DNA-binding domain-containing protein [Mesorhizobium sp. CAU 1732]|uniref:antitoxin n=1 Tax=Mesorhizobium sp. CAU 1732 TaxID=3140358 RepID=UPI0032605218